MKTKTLVQRTGFALLLATAGACSSTYSVSDTVTEIETETAMETSVTTEYESSVDGILDTGDMFTERDLTNTPDLSDAVYLTVSDDTNLTISEEGVYVISGSAQNACIYVDVDDSDKVQIVLDGVTISNENMPAIYVLSADKVFVTTTADSSLSVTGTFISDTENENDLDAVIYSCDDLVMNGTATLNITSSQHGIKSKDDLKITGGTYVINSGSKGITAHDSIRIAGGTITISAGTDGLHAEDNDDDTVGYIYIASGNIAISAGDDGIHATTIYQQDGGNIEIATSVEGIEATYVQINGGTVSIYATDDGINASQKSTSYNPTIHITGGDITITTPSGDTDGVDSNGNFIMEGGTLTLNCSGMSSVDYDGTGTLSGGTLIVNGQEITDLSSVADQMGGGFGRQPGGMNNGGMGGGPNQNGGPNQGENRGF